MPFGATVALPVSLLAAWSGAIDRGIPWIWPVVLAMAVFMSPQFFAPYTTPMGSLLAAGLAATYLCCLVMLRRKTVPPPAPRFLRSLP